MTAGSTGTHAIGAQVKPLYGVAPKPPAGKGKGKPWSSQNKPKARKKTSSRRR